MTDGNPVTLDTELSVPCRPVCSLSATIKLKRGKEGRNNCECRSETQTIYFSRTRCKVTALLCSMSPTPVEIKGELIFYVPVRLEFRADGVKSIGQQKVNSADVAECISAGLDQGFWFYFSKFDSHLNYL